MDVSIIDNNPNCHVKNKRLVYTRGVDPTTKQGHAWVIDRIKVMLYY